MFRERFCCCCCCCCLFVGVRGVVDDGATAFGISSTVMWLVMVVGDGVVSNILVHYQLHQGPRSHDARGMRAIVLVVWRWCGIPALVVMTLRRVILPLLPRWFSHFVFPGVGTCSEDCTEQRLPASSVCSSPLAMVAGWLPIIITTITIRVRRLTLSSSSCTAGRGGGRTTGGDDRGRR